ncbi:MAG: clostripain-related cysteine peptidase, partial [Promethearchaeota archaeon]
MQLFIVVNKQDFIEVNNEATDVIELSQEKVEAPHLMRRSRQTKSWTFMVYMDGDNDLEEVAITDFNEMEYGLYQSGLAEEMNVVIIFDRHSNYDSSNGNWVETRYYQIDPDNNLDMNIESTMISNLGEINMGHPNTLTNFITWALTNYPADHSALVFWDHGNGIDSLCIDETNGDSLTYAEIYDGLVAVNNTLNESLHFDFIGADICFGQLLEVTWQLRNFTDYYVASEASEPTEGWAYDLTFSTFNDT